MTEPKLVDILQRCEHQLADLDRLIAEQQTGIDAKEAQGKDATLSKNLLEAYKQLRLSQLGLRENIVRELAKAR